MCSGYYTSSPALVNMFSWWYQSCKWSPDIDRMILLSSSIVLQRPTCEQHLLLMFSKLRFHLLQLFPWQSQAPFGNQTWLAGKSLINAGFNMNINYQGGRFHCHVWLPDGIWGFKPFCDLKSDFGSNFLWGLPPGQQIILYTQDVIAELIIITRKFWRNE